MAQEKLIDVIFKDLSKVRYKTNLISFVSALIFNNGFKRLFFYRLVKKKTILSPIYFLIERHLKNKYLVYISKHAKIGTGFCLPHCFSIIISDCVIGNDVTVLQQVTIGSSRGGNRSGCPNIGNNVFVGAGAKIIGAVTIGDNVVIGANAVITKDIPSGSVVGGIPAKILSSDGEKQVKYWCSSLEEYNKIL